MKTKNISLSFFWALGFTFLFLLNRAFSEDSNELYSKGKYLDALRATAVELNKPLPNSAAFLSRLRLATTIFSQELEIPLSELISVYEAAKKQATKFNYKERVDAEEEAVSDIFSNKKEKTLKEVEDEIDKDLSLKKKDQTLLKGSTDLFALTLWLTRRTQSDTKNMEWLFLLGRALDLDSHDGMFFLEKYLDSTSKSRPKQHLKDALAMLLDEYEREYGPKLPDDIAAQLKVFKSKSGLN